MTPDVEALIQQTALVYGLAPDLLRAQVLVESGGDPHAFRVEAGFYERYVRHNTNAVAAPYGPLAACSYGLLQIMLETACEIGFDGRPEQLFEPRVGLAWGAKYLKMLLTRYGGDVAKALAAYNGGAGAVTSGPPYRTQAYVDKVLAQKEKLA